MTQRQPEAAPELHLDDSSLACRHKSRRRPTGRRSDRPAQSKVQRMLEVMLTSSSVDAPATVLWTRTTAMSITAAVTLAQMKPMMRSAALSAIDPVPYPFGESIRAICYQISSRLISFQKHWLRLWHRGNGVTAPPQAGRSNGRNI